MKRMIILLAMALVLLIGISTASAQPHPPAPSPEIEKRISGEGERPHPSPDDSRIVVRRGAGGEAGGYDLSWHTVAGGGATFSTGGSYSLGGSIGQPEAQTSQVLETCEVCPPYTLAGGFWGGASIANYDVYLPLMRR